MINVVFLYAEMVPSWLPTFQVLVKHYSANVHVIHWDHKKKTPYIPQPEPGVFYYPRSNFDTKKLKNLVHAVDPKIIFISGWMDHCYLWVARYFVELGIPVVSGFDDWWMGTFKQNVATLIPRFLTKKFISHAWIAGPRQYEYVKRLHFSDSEIVNNLLSCDYEFFSSATKDRELDSKNAKSFLYVGRFSEEKGIQLLVDAYSIYSNQLGGEWHLECIGNGPLEREIRKLSCVRLQPFLDSSDLRKAYQRANVFVMPSLRDYSPLVVHEAASAGLPLILSSNVGNAPLFAINGYNSIIFESGSAFELAKAMRRMESMAPSELFAMGIKSSHLASRVTPEICAASLMSVIQ